MGKNGKLKSRTLSAKQGKRYPNPISDSLFIHRKYEKKIMRRIKKTPVENIGDYRYSGLWFFLLPNMVERISGQSFDQFFDFNFCSTLSFGDCYCITIVQTFFGKFLSNFCMIFYTYNFLGWFFGGHLFFNSILIS